ncbi:hypothetical protein DPMN_013424 [Dreissena polymorpha]|uniref:Uncharacterized protein n=1 Tax=Dreissena polymorpha TaxID=45954 RepID=A0A9D4N5F4_DREPO|nr:hypothetical protein DPMN_013423 [Dreissena polymorpha]KAH3889370.1 hypothetical protein DPMN_013424 [Dreissena polymorpha]
MWAANMGPRLGVQPGSIWAHLGCPIYIHGAAQMGPMWSPIAPYGSHIDCLLGSW